MPRVIVAHNRYAGALEDSHVGEGESMEMHEWSHVIIHVAHNGH